MAKISKGEYLSFRHRYKPEIVKLVIIAESPPASGLYFYNAAGRTSEPLFAALMQELHLSPLTKEEGLRAFKQNGWVLVDATYQPVNGLSDLDRAKVIEKDYPSLRSDLCGLIPDRQTPLILIKANVCRILGPKLEAEGFNVLNRRQIVYFPANGWRKEFRRQFARVLKSARNLEGR